MVFKTATRHLVSPGFKKLCVSLGEVLCVEKGLGERTIKTFHCWASI